MCFTSTAQASTQYDLPANNGFKAYMDWRKITNTASEQYKMQKDCETDANGLRIKNGRYCVAIGQGYGAHVGTYVDATLDTGVVLPCVVGDFKGKDITDSSMRIDTTNGSVLEFIVDEDIARKTTHGSGTISTLSGFAGSVKSMLVYEDGETGSNTTSLVDTVFDSHQPLTPTSEVTESTEVETPKPVKKKKKKKKEKPVVYDAGVPSSFTDVKPEIEPDIQLEESIQNSSKTGEFMVTGKYTIDTNNKPLYFLEYACAEGPGVIAVDFDTYSTKTCYVSFIKVR